MEVALGQMMECMWMEVAAPPQLVEVALVHCSLVEVAQVHCIQKEVVQGHCMLLDFAQVHCIQKEVVQVHCMMLEVAQVEAGGWELHRLYQTYFEAQVHCNLVLGLVPSTPPLVELHWKLSLA